MLQTFYSLFHFINLYWTYWTMLPFPHFLQKSIWSVTLLLIRIKNLKLKPKAHLNLVRVGFTSIAPDITKFPILILPSRISFETWDKHAVLCVADPWLVSFGLHLPHFNKPVVLVYNLIVSTFRKLIPTRGWEYCDARKLNTMIFSHGNKELLSWPKYQSVVKKMFAKY